jgi:hypothetical protein
MLKFGSSRGASFDPARIESQVGKPKAIESKTWFDEELEEHYGS